MFAAPFLVWKDLEAGEAGGEAGLTGCDQAAPERSLGKTGWWLEAVPASAPRNPRRAPRPRRPSPGPLRAPQALPPQTPAELAWPSFCLRLIPRQTPTPASGPPPPPPPPPGDPSGGLRQISAPAPRPVFVGRRVLLSCRSLSPHLEGPT